MLPIRARAAGIACAALIAVPALAAAQSAQGEAESKSNPVVAVVNGEEIRHDEVMAQAEQLPAQYRQRIDTIFPQLIDRMVDMQLAAQAAEDAGMADSEEVKARMAELRQQVMRDVYLQQKVDAYITEERLRAKYEAYVEKEGGQDEVKASHILVENEDKAKELIAKLDGGADFATLAKEHSTGPSASKGGDLGFFAKGQMVPAFEKAAFALDTGTYTAEPVKSDFGWHVIKVMDRRTKQPKSFEEMKPKLRQQLQREAVQETLAGLREGAEIETFPERHEQVTGGDQGGGQN